VTKCHAFIYNLQTVNLYDFLYKTILYRFLYIATKWGIGTELRQSGHQSGQSVLIH